MYLPTVFFFLLIEVPWMTDIHRENVAHMLASMHLVLRQQDGQERDTGEYRHITNTSYEKFVERLVITCPYNKQIFFQL